MKYDPKNWRNIAQIEEYIYANHHYRIIGTTNKEATLVNDQTRSVHTLSVTSWRMDKEWYLSILQRLDEGETPERTRESRLWPEETYARFDRK